MKNIYITAQGRQIDIDGLRVANEETIAVGNMKVNARGDKLGAGGSVAETRNQVQNEYHRLNTPVPQEFPEEATRNLVRSQVASGASMEQGRPMADPIDSIVTTESVPIVEQEVVTDPVPSLRGALASALAQPATITQQPIKPANKKTGPARI